MEVIIAVFIGVWLSGSCVLAYRQLKKENQKTNTSEREENA